MLGRDLAQQQQITVQVRGQTHRLDALLEADSGSVRLALISMGQVVARLEWDGVNLIESRAKWLPDFVQTERILSDLQFVYWPVAAIRSELPAAWGLDEEPGARLLTLA